MEDEANVNCKCDLMKRVKEHPKFFINRRVYMWNPYKKAFILGSIKSYDQKNKLHKVDYSEEECDRVNLETKIFYFFDSALGDSDSKRSVLFNEHYPESRIAFANKSNLNMQSIPQNPAEYAMMQQNFKLASLQMENPPLN